MMEKQTRRRCGGGGPKVTVGLFQQMPKIVQGSFASCDLHHRSDQIPNHMMKEAIGGDPECEPERFPGLPTGFVYRTPVPPLWLSRLGKRIEAMFAHDRFGRAPEKHRIQRLCERPTPVAVEGRPGLRRKTEMIEISAVHRVVAGMEIRGRGLYTLDPDVVGQYGR